MPHRFKLYDNQRDHVDRLERILKDNPVAFDFSPPGTGKTITALELAERFSKSLKLNHNRMVLITMKGLIIATWDPTTLEISYECLATSGVEMLRGTFSRGNKSALLRREGDEFTLTEEFLALIEEGILLVFDEYHKLKNQTTAQARALFAIVTAIVNSKSQNSRALFMSGTPILNKREIESTYRLSGILQQPTLIEYQKRTAKFLQTG